MARTESMASRSSAGRSFVRITTPIDLVSAPTESGGGAPIAERSAPNDVVRSVGSDVTQYPSAKRTDGASVMAR